MDYCFPGVETIPAAGLFFRGEDKVRNRISGPQANTGNALNFTSRNDIAEGGTMTIQESAASLRTTSFLSFAFILLAGFVIGATGAAAQGYDYSMPQDKAVEKTISEDDLKKLLEEGMEAMQAKDYATAESKFQEILDENPSQPQVNYYMAVVKIGEGDVPASVDYLDMAIAADPEYVEPRHLLAKIALMTGNTDVAQAQLDALKGIQATCASGECGANTELLAAAINELEGLLS